MSASQPGSLAKWDEHASEEEQHHEEPVDHGQVDQRLQGSGQKQADTAEGDGAEHHGPDGGTDQRAGAGWSPRVPTQGEPDRDQHRGLDQARPR